MIKYILHFPILLVFFGTISIAQNNAISLQNTKSLSQYVGKTVTVTGTISKIIWAHIAAPPKGYPVIEYLDSDNFQTVLYLKQKTKCEGNVQITGRVVEIKGASSPKGSSQKSKAEGITEYHIAVDEYKCIE
jgi:hypothetical protein